MPVGGTMAWASTKNRRMAVPAAAPRHHADRQTDRRQLPIIPLALRSKTPRDFVKPVWLANGFLYP